MTDHPLKKQRAEIDRLDREIISLLAKRYNIVSEVVPIKMANDLPVIIEDRVNEVLDNAATEAKTHALPTDYIRKLYRIIIDATCAYETELITTYSNQKNN